MPEENEIEVKMTVEVPKSLHREAKKLAIVEDRTLKEIVTRALEWYLLIVKE